MKPFRVAIFGAGNIGTALAVALSEAGGYEITLSDTTDEAMDNARRYGAAASYRSAYQPDSQRSIAARHDLVVAAVPDSAVLQIAQLAADANVHYLDFSRAADQTRAALASLASQRAVFTGCGASPGLSENLAVNLIKGFSLVQDLTVRVGAIPRFTSNRLGYGRIWNMNGLFDEYLSPSSAIRDKKLTKLASLEGVEHFAIDGVSYEAFNTASGSPQDLTVSNVEIENLTFKTIRHPGHLEYIKFLFDDLGLRKRRDMLTSLLGNGLPEVKDDVVLMFLTARGTSEGKSVERSIFQRLSPSFGADKFNALTRVAVGYAATLIDQLRSGTIQPSGFVDHWRTPADVFMNNPILAGTPASDFVRSARQL